MNVVNAIKTIIFFVMIFFQNQSNAPLKIGVFADVQYAPYENINERYYKNSIQKLNKSMEQFNAENLNFVVGLGDLIDKDFSSFENTLSNLRKSKHAVYQVIGNHDLSVEDEYIESVPQKLGLKKEYYSFTENRWRFIFLNGNEITLLTKEEEVKAKAEKMLKKLSENNKPNDQTWNGGLGEKQILWLSRELKTAEKKGEKAIIFCHYPVYPLEKHCLWDYEKVLKVLEKHSCVKLWLNGHNHAGNYGKYSKIHFVTLKGMVETETKNAFAIISLHENRIEIDGFGREENRILTF